MPEFLKQIDALVKMYSHALFNFRSWRVVFLHCFSLSYAQKNIFSDLVVVLKGRNCSKLCLILS